MAKGKEQKPVVLQVLPELDQGGVERGTIEIAECLKQKGFDNFVASQGGRLVYNLEKAQVKHFTLPLKTKNIFKLWLNSFKLSKIIKENGINIVHARSRAPAWSAYWAAKRCNVKFVTTFHGTYGLGPKGLKKIYNRVMTYGQIVIAISEHIRKHILENYHVDKSRIKLVHRCVDTNKFSPNKVTSERIVSMIKEFNIPEDKPVILLIGRLTRWKGQKLLINALSQIKNRDFYCVLLGDDQGRTSYKNELEEAIKDKHMEGKFIFIRHLNDVPTMMMISSIIVSASLEPEAFGRIAIEGQAMGKVVIASNIGGSLENIVDGTTGKLFESGNAQSLAETLDWALNLKAKEKEKISKAAMLHIKENFTKEIMCDKTLQVYKEVLKLK